LRGNNLDPKKREELEAESRFTTENREKKQLVTLGGIAITESGKMVKSGYFRHLQHNLDDYENITFTPEEAQKINLHLMKLSTGSSAMTPMYCAGPKCPFADRCPLQQVNKAPLGKQCIIEVQLIRDWIMKYFEEFDVDPNNFTEVGYVSELADLMVQEMRLNMLLAKPENSTMLMDQVVGVDSEGDPIVQKQISPYMEIKEKISNRRTKIIKLMVGDRQEKYKKEAALKVRLDSDPSSQMAAMRQKLENLRRELDQVAQQAVQEEKEKALTPDDVLASDDHT
jgi:hypothetical protein